MDTRNQCLIGLVAATTLLAGCMAQYRNQSSCEDLTRQHFAAADTVKGTLKIVHTGVSYQGSRVVVEGQIARDVVTGASGVAVASAASGAVAASGASAASAAAVASTASATSMASDASADSSVPDNARVASASSASSASAATTASAPLPASAAKVTHRQVNTPAAAECTFSQSGLASFRWIAPADLAKTTPDTHAD